MKIPNGVIIVPRNETDFIAGDNNISYKEVLPSGDWTNFLPSSERQNMKYGDTSACVTFSALNSIECQLNFLITFKRLNLGCMAFLNDSGFIDSFGKINFADRYTAKMSGTIQGQGNSLFAVADSIRHDGLLPEKDYPSVDNIDEYYAEIPQALKDKAKEIYKYFDFSYEWVFSDFEKHLKQAPLQIATAVCSGWFDKGAVQSCELPVSHATLLFKRDVVNYDFDSYDPFVKTLALDYKLPYVLKLLISNKNTMNRVLKSADKQDSWVIKENRHRIPDYETFSYFEKLGFIGMPETVSEEELNKYAVGEPLPSIKLTRALEPIVRDIFLEE